MYVIQFKYVYPVTLLLCCVLKITFSGLRLIRKRKEIPYNSNTDSKKYESCIIRFGLVEYGCIS